MAVVSPHVPVRMFKVGSSPILAYVSKCKWVDVNNVPISDPGQVSSYLNRLGDPQKARLGPYNFQDKDGSDNAPVGTWHYMYDDESTQFGNSLDLTGDNSDLNYIA